MKTYENNRIRVTVPDNICRAEALSEAMRMLGNQSEAQLVASEIITDDSALEAGRDAKFIKSITEEVICKCNVNTMLMRYYGGYRLFVSMLSDIEAAWKIVDNTDRAELIRIGRQALLNEQNRELEYREMRGRVPSGWKIEIIGEMPEQIGMCRFNY